MKLLDLKERKSGIDGLRGVAVAIVFLFHLDVPGFGGGFVGVDVFFVISGFLISSVLANQSLNTATIFDFYSRRMKRLLPVFLVVAFVVVLIATFVLLPGAYINFWKSLYSSMHFASNNYFDAKIHDYFAQNAKELPLLNTWSLSVEWQFYLIFPLLYLFSARFFRGMARLYLWLAIAFLLLGASMWWGGYFASVPRFWELAVGVCLGEWLRNTTRQFSFGKILSCFPLAMLLLISFYYEESVAYPGFLSLPVMVVACLLIVSSESNPVLLSGPVVKIGEMSYSIYLIHWPLIAMASYIGLKMVWFEKAALIVLVLVLSFAAYRLIEKPGRKIKSKFLLLFIALFFIPLLSVRLGQLWVEKNKGFPQRLGQQMETFQKLNYPFVERMRGACSTDAETKVERCVLGDLGSSKLVVLLGDSHANHYRIFMDKVAKDAKFKLVSFSASECFMASNAANLHKGKDHSARCKASFELANRYIDDTEPEIVSWAQRWAAYGEDRTKLAEDVALLNRRQGGVLLLGPVGEPNLNMRECFERHLKLREKYAGECDIFDGANPLNRAAEKNFASLVELMQSKFKRVSYVDVQASQCVEGGCLSVVNGVPLYDDSHHINGYAADYLAESYLGDSNPLLKLFSKVR